MTKSGNSAIKTSLPHIFTRDLGGRSLVLLCIIVFAIMLGACGDRPWNNPYPKEDDKKNVMYSSFQERPKHLDPARSYSEVEYQFLAQIYEPPLQYHYLKRPYELVPLTALAVPKPVYVNAQSEPVGENNENLAYSLYEIKIQPGIQYQPHPSLAKDKQGNYLYHALSRKQLSGIYTVDDFVQTGSRELIAQDYVYQIKRLANPALNSPILPVMAEYIVGLPDLADRLKIKYDQLTKKARDQGLSNEQLYLDLRQYSLSGVEAVDRYTYRIKIKGKYPQIVYWLAMPFFAPMPWEADKFYSQPGMAEKNLNLHWYPIGSGPYMLAENNPNQRMVLLRNPNFHGEAYPGEGEPQDQAAGLLKDAGKPMPFIDKIVFNLEKESIPYWNKFLQGYYDASGINSESFDQVVQVGGQGEINLTDDMVEKGIQLSTSVEASTYYMGFNMLDDVVGGYSERARKLRQAIAIAVDYEEYITIFLNGRGIEAQSPLPPGIFGYRDGKAGLNPYVFQWVDGKIVRKPISEAKRLLADAGYAQGINQHTQKPLVLYMDTTSTGPEGKARLDWFRKQFQKIDIQLVFRETQYNRFQTKMLNGSAQIFQWGWNADYPDPENFLFLLYGPNGKVEHSGENAANYASPAFDRYFVEMKNMKNGPERMAVIKKMVDVVRRDSPWLWGFHPKSYGLHHEWMTNYKPHVIAKNTLKYKSLDVELRDKKRRQWNHPVTWPIWMIVIVLLAGTVPAVLTFWRREHQIHIKQVESSE